MSKTAFSPYTVAMVTPFQMGGELQEDSVRSLVAHCVDQAVPALLVSGSTGEQHSMSVEERSRLYAWSVGSVPVYAGVAAVRTRDAVALARAAEKAGCEGIMLGFPPYLRLTQLDAVEYVRQVGSATALPLLIYNNPLRTAFDLVPGTLDSMVSQNPRIRAIKETGDPSRAAEIKRRLGTEFQVFSGGDRSIVDYWARGYDGLTSVAGNLWPRELAAIVSALRSGNASKASDLLKPLEAPIEVVVESQLPSSLKHGMRHRGLPGGWCREPLGHLGTELERRIENALGATGSK